VGIADHAVYVAVGRGALDVLKEAVAKTETEEIPPLTVTVSVREVSEFTAEHGSEHERARAAKAAKILQASAAEDNVTLRQLPVENGIRYRLSVDPGVVQLFFRGAELPVGHPRPRATAFRGRRTRGIGFRSVAGGSCTPSHEEATGWGPIRVSLCVIFLSPSSCPIPTLLGTAIGEADRQEDARTGK